MPSIVPTIWPISSPPRVAAAAQSLTIAKVPTTVSAMCFTVEATCPMLVAVSSRLAAVCSVRADRSSVAEAVSMLAVCTSLALVSALPTMWRRLTCIALRVTTRWAASSLRQGVGLMMWLLCVICSSWPDTSRSPPIITLYKASIR